MFGFFSRFSTKQRTYQKTLVSKYNDLEEQFPFLFPSRWVLFIYYQNSTAGHKTTCFYLFYDMLYNKWTTTPTPPPPSQSAIFLIKILFLFSIVVYRHCLLVIF